ncbi:hypothetical protein [Sphaerimonospora thailandensis]|uniref:Uncharacterized protein n=1 Tax=Sphaerimonospora thailandensis TaxID=795644 RepID=A0A8J3R908_9ACTN|nr:hypothetical protein [Sphaerimonospora thailandensis]GIH69582.1 hypothetical protein Mth01_18350 [Sphaerimonospora thailandensis]
MAPRHFPALAIGVLVAGVLTAGVATVFSSGSAETGGPPVPVPTSAEDFVLPMDAYDLSPAQHLEVARVHAKLAEECMRAFGHHLRIPVADSTPYPGNMGYILWLGDNQIERYGYGTPPGRVDDPYESYGVSDAEFRVLEGKTTRVGGKKVPVGGCNGAVEGILNAGAPGLDGRGRPGKADASRLAVFMDDASLSAYKDPGLRVADAAWAECMHRVGYAYEHPMDAVGDRRWAITAKNDHDPPPQGTPAEIRTAVDDHRCRLETNYYGKRQAIYVAHQQKIIDADPHLFANLRILMDTRLRNARQVNSGAPVVRPWG